MQKRNTRVFLAVLLIAGAASTTQVVSGSDRMEAHDLRSRAHASSECRHWPTTATTVLPISVRRQYQRSGRDA